MAGRRQTPLFELLRPDQTAGSSGHRSAPVPEAPSEPPAGVPGEPDRGSLRERLISSSLGWLGTVTRAPAERTIGTPAPVDAEVTPPVGEPAERDTAERGTGEGGATHPVSERPARVSDGPVAAGTVEPAPRAMPRPVHEPSAGPSPDGRRDVVRAVGFGGYVTVPTSAVYAAIAVGILIGLFAYVAGFSIGKNSGIDLERERLAGAFPDRVGDPSLSIVDPLDDPTDVTARAFGSVLGGSGGGGSGSGERASSSGVEVAFTAAESFSRVPLRSGHNYLRLATVDRAGAERMVRYLAERGAGACAVRSDAFGRVDSGRGGRQNPRPMYVVFATDESFPSPMTAGTAEPKRFEDRIRRLGAEYNRRTQTATFPDPVWQLVSGPG